MYVNKHILPGWLGNIGIDQKKLSYLASLREFGIKLISANPKKLFNIYQTQMSYIISALGLITKQWIKSK